MRRVHSTCSWRPRRGARHRTLLAAAAIFATAGLTPGASLADEGGVSFWLPGLFGSLAAVPAQPGWQGETFFYNTNVRAGADVATAREITIGRFNPTVNLGASLRLSNDTPLQAFFPNYVFSSPVL